MTRRAFVAISSFLLAVAAHATVLQITVNDMIHPISDEYIGRAIADAARAHDSALVIVMTTPGGLLDSTRSIVEKMMTAPVPVVWLGSTRWRGWTLLLPGSPRWLCSVWIAGQGCVTSWM